jgi:hypothetical protein
LRVDRPHIIVDVAIDVASPALGCSAVTPARALLLEGGPKVHQLLEVLIDLGLELIELLKLGSLRPLRGRHHGPLSWGPRGQHLLKRSATALSYEGGIPRGYLLDLHVEAFT